MYHHVDTIPILRFLWITSFESVWFACISVWFHVGLLCANIFCGCGAVDAVSGVSCNAGNTPHSHEAAWFELFYLVVASFVGIGLQLTSVALSVSVILESIIVNRWLLSGPRYYFVRTLGI